jgi:predicted DNA-binding transcriptional regulator AlpA
MSAVSFRVCCQLLGLSVRTGERLLAQGRFPIPELPRLTHRRTFSQADIDRYLDQAATEHRRLKKVS